MIKFMDSFYSKTTGFSKVYIKKGNKEYTGTARLHPEDLEYSSEMIGCGLAETRAIIKALKDEAKDLAADFKSCKDFVTAITQYKGFDKNSDTAKAMFRQLNLRERRLQAIRKSIKEAEKGIREKDKHLMKIRQMKKEKGNLNKED